jgi:hypothetical protein
MPIEIRELVIQANLVNDEGRDEDSTQVLTEEDISTLKEDIVNTINKQGVRLMPDARRQLMDDILREVKKMMDDRWRR